MLTSTVPTNSQPWNDAPPAESTRAKESDGDERLYLRTSKIPTGGQSTHCRSRLAGRVPGDMEDHHKLRPEQREHADKIVTVASIGWYHGGDPVYTLEGVPGLWLDQRPAYEHHETNA